jgi:mono/diheme cytochrome c family protein
MSQLARWIEENTLYDGLRMQARGFLMVSALPAWAIGIAAGMAGCRTLPQSKPASEWTSQEARGAEVFQAKCARCHYPTTTQPLHGPGLQAITKETAMPSGAPPTDERLTAVILHGRGMMPATSLDDEQLSDLLAYLHTL